MGHVGPVFLVELRDEQGARRWTPSRPATAGYGPFVGVIKTDEQYGVALPKGSRLLKAVDRALGSLIADGTVQRLQKKWLSTNLTALTVLN